MLLGGPSVLSLVVQEEVIMQVGQIVTYRISVEVLGMLSDHYGFLDCYVSPITLSLHNPGTIPINQVK